MYIIIKSEGTNHGVGKNYYSILCGRRWADIDTNGYPLPVDGYISKPSMFNDLDSAKMHCKIECPQCGNNFNRIDDKMFIIDESSFYAFVKATVQYENMRYDAYAPMSYRAYLAYSK